jgi:diaminopimelate epimerase
MQSGSTELYLIKYQALGNDYLVIEPGRLPWSTLPTQEQLAPDPPDLAGYSVDPRLVRHICDRHYGAGADGLLIGPLPASRADFGLLIYNPDGSLAEKSGNGLRIFARYLAEQNLVGESPFTIQVSGGIVRCHIQPAGMIRIEMGQPTFDSRQVPVTGPPRQVINETLQVQNQEFRFCAVSLGNPHCVILQDALSPEEARYWGPMIEHDIRFPNRINVQFMQVLDRANIRIEIWERGAGYTLASGSSSCAAAFAAYRLGLCDPQMSVHMPGGCLEVAIDPEGYVLLTGPAERVYEARLSLPDFDEIIVNSPVKTEDKMYNKG